jgi:excisionase family DNA binding protein
MKVRMKRGKGIMAIERRWLKVTEAGEYLGMHPKSVYRSCSQRKIPFSRAPGIGVRIDKRELDALLERQGLGPGGGRKGSARKKARA